MKVWWLTQTDLKMLYNDSRIMESLPTYISDEIIKMTGRPLRGRLWGPAEVMWDDSKPMADLCSQMGGIIIYDSDVSKILNLLGFITDLELNRWPE